MLLLRSSSCLSVQTYQIRAAHPSQREPRPSALGSTRLPSKPESGSAAAQAKQRSRLKPDKEAKPTSGRNLVLEQLRWVPTGTSLSRIGPDRSRSSRPALRWKTRMPLHRLRKPVTRSGSLRRKRDTDQLLALVSLSITLTQSLARNSESISNGRRPQPLKRSFRPSG
jgi:hypothetical protein